jgi:hypothetical protein
MDQNPIGPAHIYVSGSSTEHIFAQHVDRDWGAILVVHRASCTAVYPEGVCFAPDELEALP